MSLDADPTVKTAFADFSEPLLEKLRSKLSRNKRATVINVDFTKSAWTQDVELKKSFDSIVSGFAIHYQPNDRKRKLYAEL